MEGRQQCKHILRFSSHNWKRSVHFDAVTMVNDGWLFYRTLCGCRVRVELSNGEKRSRTRGAPPPWSRRPRDRDDYRRRSPPPRRR